MEQPKLIDSYKVNINNIIVKVNIVTTEEEPTPLYLISITNISDTTKLILEKIREEFVTQSSRTLSDLSESFEVSKIQEDFKRSISRLITKYFPNVDARTKDMLLSYIIQQNIGLGSIEILLNDANLEEVVVNNAKEFAWVYHRQYGWLKTNINIPNEARIRHYATQIGREVSKEITTLNPLMDAHLRRGDRVNATLFPISSRGNTITIRKFAIKPWTITDFLNDGAISFEGAALLWLAVQYELPTLIAGGTASGKTSMLNVLSNFFPPNQRIISIEDTRELTLPQNLHWVPLETRLPNPEGKGGVAMLDLIVNSLRMRPDRILVGEIRRKSEAEVLFEAMHTGHSVYATVHANNVQETVTRLTHPPIDIPKMMLSALSLIVVQHLNRRTGRRGTLQIAEITPDGDGRLIMQYNAQTNNMGLVNEPAHIYEKLNLYTGLSKKDIIDDLAYKAEVLKWLTRKGINDVNIIGKIMALYYRGKPFQNLF